MRRHISWEGGDGERGDRGPCEHISVLCGAAPMAWQETPEGLVSSHGGASSALLSPDEADTAGRSPGGRAAGAGSAIREQLLRSNEKQFQGGLVFKARRLLYHSTLGRE